MEPRKQAARGHSPVANEAEMGSGYGRCYVTGPLAEEAEEEA